MNAQALERLRRHREERDEEIRYKRYVSDIINYRYPDPVYRYDRLHPGLSYEFLFDRITRFGVVVRTHVRWLVPFVEREKDPKWQPPPENPLLAITVVPERGYLFPTRHTKYPNEPYHVSIAKLWDLEEHIDLYVPGGAMQYLLDRFENRTHHLLMVPTSTADETGLQLDPERDPIATDEVVQRLRSWGGYHGRPWHITL